MQEIMDTEALQFLSRFSIKPNKLGFCGQDSASIKFAKCIIDGECSGVAEEVRHFIVLNPYLQTIAEITNFSPLSYPVVEAYWLGNEHLEKANLTHYNLLLHNFSKQGVPKFLIEELKTKKPKIFIPHHLFQVLHVGVGKASGSVPFSLESINNCMIRWGEIQNINKTQATINLYSLKENKGTYQLTQRAEILSLRNHLVSEIENINYQSNAHITVAVHWGMIVKILTDQEKNNLAYWTQQVLESLS